MHKSEPYCSKSKWNYSSFSPKKQQRLEFSNYCTVFGSLFANIHFETFKEKVHMYVPETLEEDMFEDNNVMFFRESS